MWEKILIIMCIHGALLFGTPGTILINEGLVISYNRKNTELVGQALDSKNHNPAFLPGSRTLTADGPRGNARRVWAALRKHLQGSFKIQL